MATPVPLRRVGAHGGDMDTNSDFTDGAPEEVGASDGADTEIPLTDLPSDQEQPESQGDEPVEAELGEEGQGDLAPEDLVSDSDLPYAQRAPQDLRTEEDSEPAEDGDA